jgi:outer membrane protein OmpA-like peptidoglycan-associated protein
VRAGFCLALLVALAGCASDPKTLVVLLPDEDGKVGQVAVTTTAGSQDLKDARTATGASRSDEAPRPPRRLTDADVNERFAEVLAARPPVPRIFILNFAPGGADLTPESLALVPAIIAEIKSRATVDISVVGHTDTVGSNEINVRVSTTRAEKVRDVLIEAGIDGKLIDTTSHGENNPLVPTADNVDEPRNRRVEVTVR